MRSDGQLKGVTEDPDRSQPTSLPVMLLTMSAGIPGVQWGDVASWVGSIATSAALLLTYALLRVTRRDQRAQWLDQRMSQARKVSAWCESASPGGDGQVTAFVRLQNASDEPIYGTRVAVGSDWLSDQPRYSELDLSYVTPPRYSAAHPIEVRLRNAADDLTGELAGRDHLQ